MRRRSLFVLAVSWSAAFLLAAGQRADATPFSVTSGTDTSGKTLAAGETGSVSSGATLSISGSGNAITLSSTGGSTTTITNSGSILQTGTGRTIRSNTSGTPTISITNNSGALIRSANADTIRADVAGSNWTINNTGSIISLNPSLGGSQAIDFDAVTTGTVLINNFTGGVIQATAADAIRPGVNAVIMNQGTIEAIPQADTTDANSPHFLTSSDGIDSQARSGVQITNSGLIKGRHGITGGAADSSVIFTSTITNNAGGQILAVNGAGINLDGFNANESAVIVNNGSIIGNGVDRGDADNHDGDGVDVDGVINLTNTGIIRSLNAFSPTGIENSEGITTGGGTIVNSGTIEGLVATGNTHAVGMGITILGIDTGTGTRAPIYANTTITNQAGGLIRGQTSYGILVGDAASGFTVTINNNAGATVQGGGSVAAIQTGHDNVTINNAGTISAESSGQAIAFGAGNDNLNITGGAAVINGSIDGGAGTNRLKLDLGLGNTFTYASGTITNFASVEVKTGTTILDGANRISSTTALNLNGGYLKIIDAGGADGQTFATLTLGDNSILDLGNGTSLTFNGFDSYIAGKTLAVLEYDAGVSADWAIRFLGDLTGNANFVALMAKTTVDGAAARYSFSGGYTNVVPEPSVFGIIVGGVAFLGLRRRRRG